ncbi:MAG: ATP-binding cassette domain-containing protein [Nitriliruptor sp.]|uniref:ABC transporter ATP-binding protein n=1 Tax=Nitriliruptor sp. TaxID=2448056 RepID=UPI0034A0A29F
MNPSVVPAPGAPAVRARDLDVVRSGVTILRGADLDVPAGEHLAVLGPNGAGKTTLLHLLATYRFPTRGSLELLGHRLGRVDVRALRPHIGFVSVALDPLLEDITVLRTVAGSAIGSVAPPAAVLDEPALVTAAHTALERVGVDHLADRRILTLSQGERQRVRIARALASAPALLLLDEPFAGLDLGGREQLVTVLDALLTEPDGPTVVLVTHHLEELPTQLRRVLLLAEGRAVAEGPIEQVLTSAQVSSVFATPLQVVRDADGRWRATGVTDENRRVGRS